MTMRPKSPVNPKVDFYFTKFEKRQPVLQQLCTIMWAGW